MQSTDTVFRVKLSLDPNGLEFVGCWCQKIEKKESRTRLINPQVPIVHVSADGKRMEVSARKIQIDEFANDQIAMFAYPRAMPSWFLLT